MTTPLKTTWTCGASGWLALAAAPTFAAMAWMAAGAPAAICASGSGMSGMPPMDGMAWMYLLMSVFHLPPWLAVISRRDAAPLQTKGD